MKRLVKFVAVLGLLLAMVGCYKNEEPKASRVYSFLGESEELRLTNGIIVIGEKDAFYGGILETKGDGFDSIKKYIAQFYIEGNDETILNNAVIDETGSFELKNQEIGQISGEIFNDAKENSLENGLYFELTITDDSNSTRSYTLPMEIKRIA